MSINTILTTLLTQLSKISPPPAPSENDVLNLNPQHHHQYQQPNRKSIFTNLSPEDTTQLKNLLLTLHCLLPNELLLALDILDRGFVTRYIHRNNRANSWDLGDADEDTLIFIVQSTSNLDRESGGGGGKVYHVHLKTWNCSCPAFVLNCFPASLSSAVPKDDEDVEVDMLKGQSGEGEAWFGGTLRNREGSYDDQSVPVCKHILACVLAAKCPNLFGGRCLTYNVDSADIERVNEVAGWCAA